MSVDLLIAALRFAERGWHVFPCAPDSKQPVSRSGGLKDATTNIAMICHWWHRIPEANVAVRTGTESGIVVLDIDGEAGTESLRELERQHESLPRTASVVTPSGGQHYYFEHPGGDVRNSAGRLGVGIDVRADGGYVLVPPSAVNGKKYEPDERVTIAPLPQWLLTASQPKPASEGAQDSNEWLSMVREGVTEGGRNHAMARFSGHLLRRYVDVELTRELCHLVSRSSFKPALPGWEIDRTVDSVFASELRRREASNA